MRVLLQILRGILGLAFGLAILASAWLVVQRDLLGREIPSLLGYFSVTVPSGEMEPELSAGDGAIFRQGKDCAPGDVVALRQEGRLVPRRIVGATEGQYITQADSQSQPDSALLQPGAVEGTMVAYLPGLGGVLDFLSSVWGLAALAAGAIVLVFLLPLGLGGGREKSSPGRHARR